MHEHIYTYIYMHIYMRMRMKITQTTIKLHLFYIIDHHLYNTSGTALHKSECTKIKQQKLHLSLGYKLPTP